MPKLTKNLLKKLIFEELSNVKQPTEQPTSQASSADIVASANVIKKLGELKGKIEQFKKDIMGDTAVELVGTTLPDIFKTLEDEINNIHAQPGKYIAARRARPTASSKTVNVKPTVPAKRVV